MGCSARPTAPGVSTPCLSAEILGQPRVLDRPPRSQERNPGRSLERSREKERNQGRSQGRSQEKERSQGRNQERARNQERERNPEKERNQTRVRFTLLSQCELVIGRKIYIIGCT